MASLSGAQILVGVSGGIAAYKAAELVRQLHNAGADVRVCMTRAATRFITPLTLSTLSGTQVALDLFDETEPTILHTSLGAWAQVIVVAPATAHTIAAIALGLADDVLSCTVLASDALVVVAPSMHTAMWNSPSVQANVETIRARGGQIVGPVEGSLAGDDEGMGRLTNIDEIVEACRAALRTRRGDPGPSRQLAGRRVLITAGGTQEPVDAVRYLGNRSSGRMGYALAQEAVSRGAKVVVVTAASEVGVPSGAEKIHAPTAAQMHACVMEHLPASEVVIMAAAVADWTPASPDSGKLARDGGPPDLFLQPSVDILRDVVVRSKDSKRIVVGFAAEVAEDLAARAAAKLGSKKCDLLVATFVGKDLGSAGGNGFGADKIKATIAGGKSGVRQPSIMQKRELACSVFDEIAALLPGS